MKHLCCICSVSCALQKRVFLHLMDDVAVSGAQLQAAVMWLSADN